MKQVLQSLATGATEVVDLPAPLVRPGYILVSSRRTLVSAGTERMLLEFGKAGYLGKALQQPAKVKEVLEKVRTDGVGPTLEAVNSKLDQPLPLGYCNVGVVLEVGPGIEGVRAGDRVVSNGPHAEIVCVPRNLCSVVPENVGYDEAVFTVLASIALQGIRLVSPSLGESVVVTGLGLVGLLAVQILKANGCRVLGVDFDERKLELARSFGAETVNARDDVIARANTFARGRGVDAVVIAASTQSSDPVSNAAAMCRKRGRIVLVGVSGLELSRADFYEKELTFQVSCSYGPGRYDSNYEENGNDYPLGFVRWTEGRNFEAVLDMMSENKISTGEMITHSFDIERAVDAYETLTGDPSALGILLRYSNNEVGATELQRSVPLSVKATPRGGASVVSFIGAGNYAGRTLIPAFIKAGCRLKTVVTTGGVSGGHYARKFGFENVSTDLDAVFADDETDCVVIATRHNSHASLVVSAIKAGKHVFVEKPLALTLDEINAIEHAYSDARADISAERNVPIIMVGFNRRFAPQVSQMRDAMASSDEPKSAIVTVNAGAIPSDHWTQNRGIGGGRLVGEACHFIDLLRFLMGCSVREMSVTSMESKNGSNKPCDEATITLKFHNGSVGTINYYANGHKSFPKERIEVFSSGRILQLDNFRSLKSFGWSGLRSGKLFRQDKGQVQCVAAFVDSIKSGSASPISFEHLVEVSRLSIQAQQLSE